MPFNRPPYRVCNSSGVGAATSTAGPLTEPTVPGVHATGVPPSGNGWGVSTDSETYSFAQPRGKPLFGLVWSVDAGQGSSSDRSKPQPFIWLTTQSAERRRAGEPVNRGPSSSVKWRAIAMTWETGADRVSPRMRSKAGASSASCRARIGEANATRETAAKSRVPSGRRLVSVTANTLHLSAAQFFVQLQHLHRVTLIVPPGRPGPTRCFASAICSSWR